MIGLVYYIYMIIAFVVTAAFSLATIIFSIIQRRNILLWLFLSIGLSLLLTVFTIYYIFNIYVPNVLDSGKETGPLQAIGLLIVITPALYSILLFIIFLFKTKVEVKKQMLQYVILFVISSITLVVFYEDPIIRAISAIFLGIISILIIFKFIKMVFSKKNNS